MKVKLTPLQLKIMDILWTRKEATVSVVQGALGEKKKLARTTVATILARLEKQGYVAHRETETAYNYYPLVKKEIITESMISELIESFFQGKSSRLVSHLLAQEKISAEEIEKVIQMIKEHENKK